MDKRMDYTQVIWEITKELQEAESLEDALRSSLGQVTAAVGAEAGTIWFYNAKGDGRIYPSFWIGGADLTGLSLQAGVPLAVSQEELEEIVAEKEAEAKGEKLDEETEVQPETEEAESEGSVRNSRRSSAYQAPKQEVTAETVTVAVPPVEEPTEEIPANPDGL